MTTTNPTEFHGSRNSLSTEEFAIGIKVQPGTVRKRYAQTGSYFGIRPKKLMNRRLAWPSDAVEQFTGA